MKKYICLRDDDTCCVTRPEELINGYGEFWGLLPITLATIPFVHPASLHLSDLYKPGEDKYKALRFFEKNSTADFLTDYYKVQPVGENVELVEMLLPLIKKGKIEIAQHGVYHKYSETGPEMLSFKMSYEAIRDAKEYLEKVFNVDIHTFIPPSNTIDVKCVEWIKMLGLHLMTSGSISRNDNFRERAIDCTVLPQRLIDKFLSRPWYKRPMVHCFGMYVLRSSTFGATTDYNVFFRGIEEKLDLYGYAAIGTHYTCFADTKCRESFWRLLSTLTSKDDIEFLTADQYYQTIKEI